LRNMFPCGISLNELGANMNNRLLKAKFKLIRESYLNLVALPNIDHSKMPSTRADLLLGIAEESIGFAINFIRTDRLEFLMIR
jgi:hypothetical protein